MQSNCKNYDTLNKVMQKFYPSTAKYQDHIRQDVLCEARYAFLVKYPNFQVEEISRKEIEIRFYDCLLRFNRSNSCRKAETARGGFYAYGFGKMRKEVETAPPKGIFSKRQCNELPADLKTDLSLLNLSYTEKRILASYRHTSNARATGVALGMPDRKAITTFRNLRNKVKEIC